MRSDVHRSDDVAVKIDHNSRIGFDFGGIHCLVQGTRKPMNLMSPQPRIERINFEDAPRFPCRFFLERVEPIRIPPERFPSLESHCAQGGDLWRAVSMSTVRSSSWSSTPCQNVSWTSGCCRRRRRRSIERRSSGAKWRKVSSTTLARSPDAKVLISLMTSHAVTTSRNPNLITRSTCHV